MSTNTANVLLAIENEAVLQRFAAWLTPQHGVRTVGTVEDAMEALETGRDVDVLFLSNLLPDYGADAVLREVRFRDLPCSVVMVDDASGVERVQAGVDDRIAAPFDEADIRDLVGARTTPSRSATGRDPTANARPNGEAT